MTFGILSNIMLNAIKAANEVAFRMMNTTDSYCSTVSTLGEISTLSEISTLGETVTLSTWSDITMWFVCAVRQTFHVIFTFMAWWAVCGASVCLSVLVEILDFVLRCVRENSVEVLIGALAVGVLIAIATSYRVKSSQRNVVYQRFRFRPSPANTRPNYIGLFRDCKHVRPGPRHLELLPARVGRENPAMVEMGVDYINGRHPAYVYRNEATGQLRLTASFLVAFVYKNGAAPQIVRVHFTVMDRVDGRLEIRSANDGTNENCVFINNGFTTFWVRALMHIFSEDTPCMIHPDDFMKFFFFNTMEVRDDLWDRNGPVKFVQIALIGPAADE